MLSHHKNLSAMNDGWTEVPCLSERAVARIGKFVVPTAYHNEYKNKDYRVMTDLEYLGLPRECQLEIRTSILSRDVCHLDEENVTFPGVEIEFLPCGSTGVWFHISTIGIATQARNHYNQQLRNTHGGVIHIATSPAFLDEYAIAYMSRPETDRPKVRYHCDLNSLIKSYNTMLDISDVEFRIYGTTRYSMQMMYTVLICPPKSQELNENFPAMEVGKLYDVIKIQKDGGTYKLEWRPYCTRLFSFGIWDHVTFIFYIPSKSPVKTLPLPRPFMHQISTGQDRKFGIITC